jgi:hypothetical protein
MEHMIQHQYTLVGSFLNTRISISKPQQPPQNEEDSTESDTSEELPEDHDGAEGNKESMENH